MGSMRYQFVRREEPGEVRLLSISASAYEKDWSSIRHTHYFAELFYIREGEGSFLVEGSRFPVRRDDLVLINPNVEHTELSEGSSPLDYFVLGVEGLRFQFGGKEEFSQGYGVCNCRAQRELMLFCFGQMLRESERQEKGFDQICRSLMEVVLVQLLRGTRDSFKPAPPQRASKECSAVKRQIDYHYAETITLDGLAALSHLSKFYLAHAFTQAYGMSPIRYLNEKRIQCSKELLESTDYSIAQIAQQTGFGSQSYFSQSFRRACGMTPVEYRRQAAGLRKDALE